MKYSICIIMHKLGFFTKKLNTKLYTIFNNLSKDTLKEVLYPKNFIVILDEDENFYVQNMLIESLKQEKKKVIYNKNIEDDLTHFILKNSKVLTYIMDAEYLILTVNRKSLKKIDFKYVNYFLINDLNTNNSHKYPDEEVLIKEIISSVRSRTNLVLNIDNPYVNVLKHKHPGKSTGFGIKPGSTRSISKSFDFLCPICHEKLIYKTRYFRNLGNYICPNNDFETGIKTFEIEKIDFEKHKLKIDGNNYNLNTNYLIDVYYLLGFYALTNLLNLNKNIIENVISNFKNKPNEIVKNNIKLNIYEVFNGNTSDYQKKIDYISKSDLPLIIGFSEIFDNSLTDLSWLYKINFRPLSKLKNIFLFCDTAKSLEVRLSMDNLKFKEYEMKQNFKEINILMPKKDIDKFLEEFK